MSTIERFEDSEAWKRARSFAKLIHTVSNQGSFAQDYALRNQIRKAAISIVSNIAEGFERDGDKEFLQYLFVRRVPAEKCERGCTSHSIVNTQVRKSLNNCG